MLLMFLQGTWVTVCGRQKLSLQAREFSRSKLVQRKQ